MPSLSLVTALTGTVPDTELPAVGETKAITGSWLSVVSVISADAELRAVSYATAVSLCVSFCAVAVFHSYSKVYGQLPDSVVSVPIRTSSR